MIANVLCPTRFSVFKFAARRDCRVNRGTGDDEDYENGSTFGSVRGVARVRALRSGDDY